MSRTQFLNNPFMGFVFLLIVLSVFLFSPVKLRATVIIGIYNNDSVYIGSDSLVMRGPVKAYSPKIFTVSDSCCVSIANCYGGYAEDASGGIQLIFLPNELNKICEQEVVTEPLDGKIANIVKLFYSKYIKYNSLKVGNSQNADSTTRVCFWGYDKMQKLFFGLSYYFDGTNQIAIQNVFERGSTTKGWPITIISGNSGENSFLSILITSREKAIVAIQPKGFIQTYDDIQNERPVDGKIIKQFMLQMFDAHKQYAGKYSHDVSKIDKPYNIFKITKAKIEQIH